MKELPVKIIYKKRGFSPNLKVQAFQVEAGDSYSISDEQGITKEEFFSILDKASQPIDREAKSDSETSET